MLLAQCARCDKVIKSTEDMHYIQYGHFMSDGRFIEPERRTWPPEEIFCQPCFEHFDRVFWGELSDPDKNLSRALEVYDHVDIELVIKGRSR